MNTSDQSSSPVAQDHAVLPAVRLRELLDKPAPKDDAWQDEAGRMASLLAVQFSQEADESKALTSVALIGLAAAVGVKEAKNKSLKLTRWSKAPPLPLATLLPLDEQHAALLALAKIQSPWALSFINQSLADPALTLALLPDLLKWGRAASPDWAAFVAESYAGAVANCTESARAIAMLKEAPKVLRTSGFTPTEKVAEALGTLIRAILSQAGRVVADKKSSFALLVSGYHVFEQAWRYRPALLFQPALLNVLPQLATAIRALKKHPPGSLDEALQATLSMVSDSVLRFGSVAVQQYRLMVPLWVAAYSDFQNQFKLAAAVEPRLSGLILDASEIDTGIDQTYSAEVAFASLLPAWDAFVAGLPDPDRASSLGLMLNKAAGTVNVERDGVVGEVVAYDPLSHHLTTPSDQPPARVKVLRSGVQAKRTDGSKRTLVQTLVAAA